MLRKSTQKDVTIICNLYDEAINDLRIKQVDQWQNNYPNKETCLYDINHGYSYVYCLEDVVIGTVALIFGHESDYDIINQGAWLNTHPYATIHRLVVSQYFKGKHIASLMLKQIEAMCVAQNMFNIRVDTHHDNVAMQRFLLKNGFIICGVIYLKDKAKRLAYQKILK